MEGISDNVSYLCPRVPSVCFGKRYFEAGKTNLLSRFEHGQHANISKNGKVKVYLRIKPSKDAAQMLAPPQASDIHVFVCVGVLSASFFKDMLLCHGMVGAQCFQLSIEV